MANPLIFFGAGARNRTEMELPPEDFEPKGFKINIGNNFNSLFPLDIFDLLLVSFGNVCSLLTLTGTIWAQSGTASKALPLLFYKSEMNH